MKHTLPFLIVLLLLAGCHRPTKSDEQETVTITGRVTDYEGHPIKCSRYPYALVCLGSHARR